MNINHFDKHAAQILSGNEKNILKYINLGMKIVLVLNVILGCVYLLILNKLATSGFDLENIKTQQVAIQRELELVDIETTIPSSIYALESNEQIQEMPEIGKKIFLSIKVGEMAFVDTSKNF